MFSDYFSLQHQVYIVIDLNELKQLNMITKYLLSLALTLAYVYSPAQETNILDQSDQCEYYPIMEDMKTWIKDRKRAKKKKLITVAACTKISCT